MITKNTLVMAVNMSMFISGDDKETEFERNIGNRAVAAALASATNQTAYHFMYKTYSDLSTSSKFFARHRATFMTELGYEVSSVWLCDVEVDPTIDGMPAVCITRHYLNGKQTGLVMYECGYELHLLYIPFTNGLVGKDHPAVVQENIREHVKDWDQQVEAHVAESESLDGTVISPGRMAQKIAAKLQIVINEVEFPDIQRTKRPDGWTIDACVYDTDDVETKRIPLIHIDLNGGVTVCK